MKVILAFLLFTILLCTEVLHPIHRADAEAAKTLDGLLDEIRDGHQKEINQKNTETGTPFPVDKKAQQKAIKTASSALKREITREKTLKAKVVANKKKLAELSSDLKKQSGNLSVLFDTARQNAVEAEKLLSDSLVSAQLKGRLAPLKALTQNQTLPSIDDLEMLWFFLQEEMTQSGKVITFPSVVRTVNGEAKETHVTRIGLFSAISEGKYLQYQPEANRLVEAPRQPEKHFLEMAAALESTKTGTVPMAIDPSRGSVLALLTQSPDYLERIAQGGIIAYVILSIGGLALIIILERFCYLGIVGGKIIRQSKQKSVKTNNPLGRIMRVYTRNPNQETETLSHKLDEAILKEMPKLERGLAMIAIFAAIAPLLGLLGTVTGMIETFQAITRFGAGDPKLMSGGISQALVTTELGLVIAIPIILLHSLLVGKSNYLIQILDEQSAGLVASLSEKNEKNRLCSVDDV